MRRAAVILAFAAILAFAGRARSHEFRPCLLDIRDSGGGRFESAWQVPSGAPGSGGDEHVAPVFPAHCSVKPLVPGASRALLDCGEGGLAGHPIAVRGLGGAHPDALVRFLARDGSVVATSVLRADDPEALVPAAFGASPSPPPEARGAVFWSYFGAGLEHILLGLDHLLFVLALLLLVKRTPAREARSATPDLLKAITAFTLAHSVTLGMAALHVVRVPTAPVEAAIALSLVFLARELARLEGREGLEKQTGSGSAPLSLTQRRPWLVALLFGLLHGFGFAGGLAELGVPDSQIPIALAAFNLGVEAGQLAFVAAALALLALLALLAAARRAVRAPPAPYARAPAYLLGPIAVAFFIERLLRFWT